jgi:hypothetical protein
MGVNHDIYVELRTRYNTGWTPVPTEFPNESFNRPTSGQWGRFTIVINNETQMDIGSTLKTFRVTGFLVVQLFVSPNQGTIDILNQADTLADVFRNWSGQTVSCRESTVKTIGNDGNGWHQVNVIVPFKCDTQK